MFVIKYRKYFYLFSGILVAISLVSLAVWHLNLGIDFTGGSLIEVVYGNAATVAAQSDSTGVSQSPATSTTTVSAVTASGATVTGVATIENVDGTNDSSGDSSGDISDTAPQVSPIVTSSASSTAAAQTVPTVDQINNWLSALKLGGFSARPSGSDDYIIRMEPLDAAEHTEVLNALSQNGTLELTEKSFDSVGPTLGKEAANKSIVSIILVLIAIVLFITYAFRQVSRPVSSWKYGLVAIVALLHDIIIPVGVFSILGHVAGIQVDTLFITALLVILGFSIHDTIVVFDRVRENLRINRNVKKTFTEIVGDSISQTFSRSINTSLTVLLSLLVLYFVGAASTQDFILALLVGIASGTYSSIFIGSPLLVTLEQWQNKRLATAQAVAKAHGKR